MHKSLFIFLVTSLSFAPVIGAAEALSGNGPVGEVFGQKVSRQEFDFAHKTNSIFSISEREPATETEKRAETWQFLAFQKEADKQGVVVPREELEKELSRLLSEKNVTYGSYNYFLWVQENFKEDHHEFERRVESFLKVRKLLALVLGAPDGDDKPELAEAGREKKRQTLGDLITRASIQDYERDQILTIETNRGAFEVKLFPDVAPKASENFASLAQKGYYDGLVFHRVIDGFMIQGGDPTGTGAGGKSVWGETFEDEVTERVGFDRPGLLAMANSGPGTNGSQFFVTLAPKPHLNMRHTIFGEVVSGFDVVQKIGASQTTPDDHPVEDQKIIRISRKKWL